MAISLKSKPGGSVKSPLKGVFANIDSWLGIMQVREMVTAGEASDLLLDLRSMLSGTGVHSFSEAFKIIDRWLGTMSARETVLADDVSDMLLDLRSLLAKINPEPTSN